MHIFCRVLVTQVTEYMVQNSEVKSSLLFLFFLINLKGGIMLCPVCGQWVDEGEEYCPNCGYDVPFLPGDAVKIVAAVLLTGPVRKAVKAIHNS